MIPLDTISKFSWPNARACLERSALAYRLAPGPSVQSSGDPIPRIIQNGKTAAQAVIWSERDCISVAFRGSQAPEDYVHDAECWATSASAIGGGRVHYGFLSDFDSIATPLIAAVDWEWNRVLPRRKIFVMGHSLGGALAIEGAFEFSRQGWSVAGVYTFGQPRVGDAEFVQRYERASAIFPRRLSDVTWRVVNENDIVPRMPLALAGYRHGGQEVFLSAGSVIGGVIFNPPWWATMDSDLCGFARAIANRRDVLVGDHFLESYRKRISNL